ncbi:ParA family protein [Reyranella sp.]|uniref:ParA family protein n=1 Tax=Reyranella sp. TaxID=1929291 RepID=UPI003D0D25A7
MARANGPVSVCVINLKGGVGKSTISALLARNAYTRRNLDVLAVDLDPQANLSQALMHSDYDDFLLQQRASIVEIFHGYRPPTSRSSSATALVESDGVETIGLNPNNNKSLQLIPSRFDFSDNLLGAVRPDPRILARFLTANYAHKDFIIIDCAPTESILTTAAYHASGLVLVPVKPEYFATIGFPLLQQSLVNFRNSNRGHRIDVCGIVINNAFYDGGNDGGPEKADSLDNIQTEAANNGWPVFENQLPHSRGFPKIMRGNNSWVGNATKFQYFSNEFFQAIGL